MASSYALDSYTQLFDDYPFLTQEIDYSLPSNYQRFIHLTHYSRYIPELERRETWQETVFRFLDFLNYQVKEQVYQIDNSDMYDVYSAIMYLNVMPSMRLMWSAGEAVKKDAAAAYNCFRGDTEYMTRTGLKTLKETEGTTQDVLCSDGEWRSAQVKSFGKQKLQKITLRPGKASRTKLRHTFYATPNHRWLTENRGEVTDLRVGDVLPFNGVPHSSDFDLKAGRSYDADFIQGFGFGDGTLTSRGDAQIRLCGEKENYLDRFTSIAPNYVCYPPSSDGDPTVFYHKGYFSDWKKLPKDPSFAWLRGYMAADGHSDPRQPGLSSQNSEAISYVINHSAYSGLFVAGSSISSIMTTNFGERKSPLQRLTIREEGEFRVVDIEELETEEEVYCVVEPVTQSFTLKYGVLTGNCAYCPIDRLESFDEILYLLMCGSGVGFSVEKENVNYVPIIPGGLVRNPNLTVCVEDSKEGWARALRSFFNLLYAGIIPNWDLSQIRPEGARLKVFGGYASGPQPLNDLFNFIVTTFEFYKGKRLPPIAVHDIVCMIGSAVVSGGVRRSALISLSDLDDENMRKAKSEGWWENHKHRSLSNNSAVYHNDTSLDAFKVEWDNLVESGSGERGIFGRSASINKVKSLARRDTEHMFGCNPCSEIILRPREFCNLTEVVVRQFDTMETLLKKVRIATLIGTIQSTITNFRYISSTWRMNCEEERLLGVSMTGVADNPMLFSPNGQSSNILENLKQEAISRNADYAKELHIPRSAAITAVKPSGTVSQLVNSASGLHPRYSPFYLRRVRLAKTDPVAQHMVEAGVPVEDDVINPDRTWVFSFPIAAPAHAKFTKDLSAIDHAEIWMNFQDSYCEHKPSATLSVHDGEWEPLGKWIEENLDKISGVSFLPFVEHGYEQAPFEEITADQYDKLKTEMPNVDWYGIHEVDMPDQAGPLACEGGICEIKSNVSNDLA
jgi:ribonucleoside-triphosphate reductase (thioredoxin)